MNITQGLYIQLVNRSTSRIVFSAATDELTQEAFQQLWDSVGKSILKGLKKDLNQCAYFDLRVDPIVGEHPATQR